MANEATSAAEGAGCSATPMFKIHDATVRRAGKVILHVDDFTLAEGENIALLGPNGAGKSTFIQLLTREVLPLHKDEPPVVFRGQARPTLAEIKSCFGVVSSTMHDQVRVHLCAREIVCGGIFGTLGIPRHIKATPADYERAQAELERLGIGHLGDRDIMTMSTGQIRRVLVARELVHNPQALIFDEPCTGLDPQGMYHLRGVMRQLAAEGRSVILVTHYPEDIIPAIDRVLLIKDAAIYADGPKEDLLTGERMTNLFGVPLEVESNQGWYSLREVFE